MGVCGRHRSQLPIHSHPHSKHFNLSPLSPSPYKPSRALLHPSPIRVPLLPLLSHSIPLQAALALLRFLCLISRSPKSIQLLPLPMVLLTASPPPLFSRQANSDAATAGPPPRPKSQNVNAQGHVGIPPKWLPSTSDKRVGCIVGLDLLTSEWAARGGWLVFKISSLLSQICLQRRWLL